MTSALKRAGKGSRKNLLTKYLASLSFRRGTKGEAKIQERLC
jgi:hypothetical protein